MESWNCRIIKDYHMDKLLAFKVFCLESYKSAHEILGLDALDIFKKYKVFDYISSNYDVLHSFGKLHIVNDIDEYIACRE
jgi:hypothetical protein